jgi:hypothetical protein
MPSRARAELPGAVYHLLDRGDRQEEIFRTDSDRALFLATLGQACLRPPLSDSSFLFQHLSFSAFSAKSPVDPVSHDAGIGHCAIVPWNAASCAIRFAQAPWAG